MYLPSASIRRAMKRLMVEMVSPLMLESAFKSGGRKFVAPLKAAAKFPDFQDAYEYCKKGLTDHPPLFGGNWAVEVTDAGFYCMGSAPF